MFESSGDSDGRRGHSQVSALGAQQRPPFDRIDPHAGGVAGRLGHQWCHKRDVVTHSHPQGPKGPNQLHPHSSRGADATQNPLWVTTATTTAPRATTR